MKKFIITSALLTGIVAMAQDTNGKVGINTVEPQATLEIKPNTTNAGKTATTNEGIIAPKLSKERIANIATPVEGTLVYATDNAYAGDNDKVTKITEKGYYFYNGKEWVKAGADVGSGEWVYDDATKRINLKRSGQSEGFVNKVFYDAKGRYINIQNEKYTSIKENILLENNSAEVFQRNSASLEPVLNENNVVRKKFKDNIYTVNNSEANATEVIGTTNEIMIEPTANKDYTFFIGNEGRIKNYAKNLQYGAGLNGAIEISNTATSTGYLWGSRGYVLANSTGNVNNISSFGGLVANMASSGKISSMNIASGILQFLEGGNSEITKANGVNISYVFRDKNTSKITDLAAFRYDTPVVYSNATLNVTNHYGLYLSDIKLGTSNYSIYTNLGKVRFGDNVGVGVDNPTEKLEVAGNVKATSFQGANGASIFPDYVFQKYYTGISNIKADYHFKTLSQVEDFVKTNGHLPGYKSAEAIKAQGYVDLMETQLTNVEKIEELYLHSIEQEKKLKQVNEELVKKNQELEARLERLEKLK